jgi:hypothetical protein
MWKGSWGGVKDTKSIVFPLFIHLHRALLSGWGGDAKIIPTPTKRAQKTTG